MALKSDLSGTASGTSSAAATLPPPTTTVLELALYKKYTWQGTTYDAGKPYRFRNQDAMILLAEHDTGRPVWKIWRPAPPKEAPKNEVQDATSVQAQLPIEEPGVTLPPRRIDVGDDSEIADILTVSNEGDVTV
jgi:hypothetical protein